MRILKTLCFLFFYTLLLAQNDDSYDGAFQSIKYQLENLNSESFKKAVFAVENAFLDNQADYEKYNNYIELLSLLAIEIKKANTLAETYEKKYYDRDNVEKSAAIYHVMKDSTPIVGDDGIFYYTPMEYDFDDMFGDNDWSKMFVTKLLATHKGNCHSLPYLFKILANEIEIEKLHLAVAPNHVYVKHHSQKYGWYNIELTSGYFPTDAWLMASGYVTMDAIRSGIFLKALNETESVALTLIDLAQGYDKRFPDNDGSFIVQCADLALQYFPDCISAMLLKAELKKSQLQDRADAKGLDDLMMAKDDLDLKDDFLAMQSSFVEIMKLGYRQMPKQMYVNWLLEVVEEREKYENKKIRGY